MNQPRMNFDHDLRSVPEDVREVEKYIEHLKERRSSDQMQDIRTDGEIGVYLRILGRLEEAESILTGSLKIIADKNLGIRLQVQQMLRLAHVFQDQKRFDQSNRLFNEALEICVTNDEAAGFFHFALQHAGKNLFDQGSYAAALKMFEEALLIRISSDAPNDQIESSKFAIEQTRKRLG